MSDAFTCSYCKREDRPETFQSGLCSNCYQWYPWESPSYSSRDARRSRELKRAATDPKPDSADGSVETAEMVNHPKHYNSHPSGIECIVIVEHMTFNAGSAVKYLWRAGLKDVALRGPNTVEDLKKAAWYVAREIERLEKEGAK